MPVETVSSLVKQFETMRKMMRQNGILGRLMSGGQVPDSPVPGTMGGLFGGPAQLTRKEHDHKKKIAKLAKKERAKQRKRKK